MRYAILIFFISFLISCSENPNQKIQDLQLSKVYGDKDWSDVVRNELTVFYFLAPECPLCQNYAKAMRDLSDANPKVKFIGIFPGEAYSEEEIRKYLIRFGLEFDSYLDPDFKFTNLLGAEITPEAFLIDANGNTLYAGAIDNWAISLGQKRSVITKKYLADAIAAAREGLPADPKKSQAVGCFIE
jgi:thiol-disulfide isomerase/thioredoxin